MTRVRRWLAEALAGYRRHPRWVAAGLPVIAAALLTAAAVWVMRQIVPPPGDAPAGTASPPPPASTPARHHPAGAAALLVSRQREITDQLVQLLISTVHRIGLRAEEKVFREMAAQFTLVSLLLKVAGRLRGSQLCASTAFTSASS